MLVSNLHIHVHDDCFQKLTDDSHVIAIELPGHGNTAAPEEGEDISFSAHVEIINKVCKFCISYTYKRCTNDRLYYETSALYML